MPARPKKTALLLIFFLGTFLGVFFRIYPLLTPLFRQSLFEKTAAQTVSRAMAGQLKKVLDQQFPQMAEQEKWRLAHEKARDLAAAQKDQYEAAVRNAAKQFAQNAGPASGRHYLLEADPYYYLYLTEQVAKTGRLSPQMKNGLYFHPLMHAPLGYWTAVVLHPYGGYFWYRFLSFLRPGIGMMEALGSFPVFLCVGIAALFLGLAVALERGPVACFLGLVTLMLSPVFIQRSAFGWYDTDPYNYLFPVVILWVSVTGIREKGKEIPWALAAAFFTGLYSLFWTGWAFILFLLPGALLAAFLVMRWIPRFKKEAALQSSLRFIAAYLFFSFFAAMIFLTPGGFFNSVTLGWNIMHQFALSRFDVWPNMFVTVGESASIGLKKLIFLTGNYVAFAVAVAGFVFNGIRSWQRRDGKSFFRWLFLTAFSMPLLFLALKTERFSVLFVMPLAFFVMLGIDELQETIGLLFARLPKILSGLILCLLFLPLPLLMAHLVARGIKPIMNDAWFEILNEIRQKTPEDAIINSWWPPGYFISGVAHRRATVDGGTQQFHETFWMAKALASENEREAAGILRMLNTHGNGAAEYLESLGVETPEAVDLILRVVPLSREQALKQLPPEIKSSARAHFLDLTHGTASLSPAGTAALAPTYLFLYNDLIEQNLAVTVAAQWNFKKAREIQKAGKARKPYLQQVFSVLDGVLKYTPEAGLQKREGDILFFSNGLRVNLGTKEAQVLVAAQGLAGPPVSLFYKESGQVIEKKYENPGVNISALLIEEGGTWKSVLADRRLIRSMLFRLYYLGGEGLSLFRPFLAKKDAASSTTLLTYELQRDRL